MDVCVLKLAVYIIYWVEALWKYFWGIGTEMGIKAVGIK